MAVAVGYQFLSNFQCETRILLFIVVKVYQVSNSKDTPPIEITVSFTGISLSSHPSAQPETSAAEVSTAPTVPPTNQPMGSPTDSVESKVQLASTEAEDVHTPRIVKEAIKVVDKTVEAGDRIQSALESVDTLGGTLSQSVSYIDGILDVVKDFADVGIHVFIDAYR